MSMDKISNINLETTAKYQRISDLNVKFWSQDTNTAILRFSITRNNFPLSLSKENVKVFIALESGDSFIVDDKLEYEDELNGIVSYTIPIDFMRVATKVKGQVYLTTLDQEEVVVQRQFTFNVANDLIADLPAEDKIREIKYFADMREEVATMMEKLNNDFENMNDYVTQVEQTTQDGINSLAKLINDKQNAYNDNHAAKLKELNDKGSEYSAKFDDDKIYMDEKFEAFKESVTGGGLVTTDESANWQKYKITNDDGDYTFINMQKDLEAYRALPPGNYYTAEAPISGMGQTSTAGFTKVETREGSSVKHITFRPYNSSQEFLMRFYSEWSDWEIISPDYNKIETITGAQAKANEAESNAKTYTDERIESQTEVLFEGDAMGVGEKLTLTKPISDYKFIIVSGHNPAQNFSEIFATNQFETKSMILTAVNLRDRDGEFVTIFESAIIKNSDTEIEIVTDVFYDFYQKRNSGGNVERWHFNRIEGIR